MGWYHLHQPSWWQQTTDSVGGFGAKLSFGSKLSERGKMMGFLYKLYKNPWKICNGSITNVDMCPTAQQWKCRKLTTPRVWMSQMTPHPCVDYSVVMHPWHLSVVWNEFCKNMQCMLYNKTSYWNNQLFSVQYFTIFVVTGKRRESELSSYGKLLSIITCDNYH